ncbi:MAG TPA: hypothetical protein VFG46_23440 [Chryseolinea sp.]|nr:hypothetical protein [Chryseolinea sp.]
MKTRMWLLIPIIIGMILAASTMWACVEETDEPAPKIPDQQLPF